jgi:oxygen-independent coproporphyrinogen-3 oxidase
MTLSAMNQNTETVSLYVHIPFCRTRCDYCAFYSQPLQGQGISAFVEALNVELDIVGISEEVCTIYIGGGSPSCIGSDNLAGLCKQLSDRFPRFTEFTVELNPGQVDMNLLQSLHAVGVNRISLGAQSFHKSELHVLGRAHSVGDIVTAVDLAKSAGIANVSVDLIFAIPGSTVESWKYSLDSAVALDVQHISAYALTWEERTPIDEKRRSGIIEPVDEETDCAMYETAIDKLAKAGFVHYEISNFARDGFQCAHNLRYWSNDQSIGIGPAAASWYRGKRTTNIADTTRYLEMLRNGRTAVVETETPSQIENACQTAVLNLRRTGGIDLAEYIRRTGYDLTKLFASEIERNRKLGLLEVTNDRVCLAHRALAIADSVLSDFASV